ncbi:MAG: hypothetical protein A2286_11570 [Gammaproteobacteria bacterium RIFOXYA12_FULL_61_12]|nr:MAG: hypothetical protein A2514_09730 [Gammaproteobacteria bacterium RIFOXYD12_FULL_61_37]OGT94511.1 MAG: hypothetical protein A2286_11570 [Gammaproteobacteria bacterium RIFOXYA12_FULL_61_12]
MDAITYFFFNSTLLIVVLAIVFFLLGLWLGWWLWGRCCRGQTCGHQPEPANSPVASTAGAAPAQAFSAFSAEVDSGKARIDDTLGVLYHEPPEARDDLTIIKGVAEVLNGKLNAFGVYTFKQIASWDDTIIKEFSKKLAFRDRVWRENWVGQAKALHKEKYGEDLG